MKKKRNKKEYDDAKKEYDEAIEKARQRFRKRLKNGQKEIAHEFYYQFLDRKNRVST